MEKCKIKKNYEDLDKKEHLYFIDKIKNKNIVFEIKSDYYWNKNKTINEIKMKKASEIYEYYLILNNKFEKLEKIFNAI